MALESLYTNPTNAAQPDVLHLSTAKASIDIAAYCLNHPALITALALAAARGVRIRLYLDRTELEAAARGDATLARTPLYALLNNGQIAIKVKASSVLMHLKSYVVDGAVLRTGSANFTTEGEEPQDNDAVWTDDAGAIGRFQAKFEAMWNRPDNLSPQIAVQTHESGMSHAHHSH